jgi:hypothetical protein
MGLKESLSIMTDSGGTIKLDYLKPPRQIMADSLTDGGSRGPSTCETFAHKGTEDECPCPLGQKDKCSVRRRLLDDPLTHCTVSVPKRLRTHECEDAGDGSDNDASPHMCLDSPHCSSRFGRPD